MLVSKQSVNTPRTTKCFMLQAWIQEISLTDNHIFRCILFYLYNQKGVYVVIPQGWYIEFACHETDILLVRIPFICLSLFLICSCLQISFPHCSSKSVLWC